MKEHSSREVLYLLFMIATFLSLYNVHIATLL